MKRKLLNVLCFTKYCLQDLLSRLVFEKMDIVENARIDTNTNKKKKDAWNSIHSLFNKTSKVSRNLDQLQNKRKTKSLVKSKNSLYLKRVKQIVSISSSIDVGILIIFLAFLANAIATLWHILLMEAWLKPCKSAQSS